jgi:hypothetical protein
LQGTRSSPHGYHDKSAVLTPIDRTTGEARSFHVDKADAQNVMPVLRAGSAKETAIVTAPDRALCGIEGKRLTYRRIGRPRSQAGGEA